jgi:uncharacterized membrane protein
MRLAKFVILPVFLTFLTFTIVFAHGGTEEISSFHTDIQISKDNVATITETIEYDFGSQERHGIFRFMPLRTKAGESSQFYYYDFNFLNVTMDGAKVPVEVNREGHNQVIKIGDADKTINGRHVYVIAYKIWPVVEQTEEGDYLNWNLTGNNWPVEIEKASAIITFPAGTKIKDIRCYAGATGSTYQQCKVTPVENKLNLNSLISFHPYSGITANVLLEPARFSNYLAPQNPPLSESLPILGFLWGGLLVFGAFIIRVGLWLHHRYLLKQETIVPQYAPPDNLAPGEIGLLNDNRADMTEISATFIDLAVRGYIKIEQTQSKSLFKKAKYSFHLLKDYKMDKNIRDFEKQLLDLLFSGNQKIVKLDEIQPSTAAPAIQKVKKLLKKHLEEAGYYAKPAARRRKWKLVFKLAIFMGAGLLGLNLFAYTARANEDLVGFSSVFILAAPVIAWFLIRRTEFTEAGYDQWAEVQGLKMFLTVAEKDRLNFHDAPAKNPKLFNALLPSAVALGVEKQWAKQFKDMDVSKEASGWYNGSNSFNAGVLAGSLSSDFMGAVSSNFTPTQSSSSSGGFSGGGGGGGGGGSW